DLIKVGHSTKDPELRARELDNTGAPHSYIVEYEMLIEDPSRIEQEAHKALSSVRENKEWFRCSCENAIATIQRVAGGRAINESFKRADRERAEKIRKDQEKEELHEKLVNQQIKKQELAVQAEYKDILAAQFTENPFWPYWIACSIGVFLLIGAVSPKTSDSAGAIAAGIFGAVIAFFTKEFHESRRMKSSEYRALEQQQESKLREAKTAIILACASPSCQQRIRFDADKLLSSSNGAWICPKCKTGVNPFDCLMNQ
ncbi:MAG: GIY-YIG nuclease family protein, partial [Nitrospirae bacterium]|nr:GIY-YIG nuclease family protein [Nitrospirota bacterium]